MKKTKDRRVCVRNTIKNVIIIFFLLGAVGGIIAVKSLIGDHGLFGYGARIIMSSSMEKNSAVNTDDYRIKDIPVKSLIIIKLVPPREQEREKFYSGLKEGDVLTFVYKVIGESITITHRVCNIEKNGGGYTITLRGDNGPFAATQVINSADAQSENRIIGKVVFCSRFLGVVACVLREPLFFAAVCIIVLTVILLKALGYKSELSIDRKFLLSGGQHEKKK